MGVLGGCGSEVCAAPVQSNFTAVAHGQYETEHQAHVHEGAGAVSDGMRPLFVLNRGWDKQGHDVCSFMTLGGLARATTLDQHQCMVFAGTARWPNQSSHPPRRHR